AEGTYTLAAVDADADTGEVAYYTAQATIDGETVTLKSTEDKASGRLVFTIQGEDEEGNAYDTGVVGFTIETNGGYTVGDADGQEVVIEGGETQFQIGANRNQTIGLSINDMTTNGLGIDSLDISGRDGAQAATTALDSAIKSVSD